MPGLELIGHDAALEAFRKSLQRDRLASSFLFVGPSGIGKRRLALRIAAALLCETRPAEELKPCGNCPACQQLAAGTHPDLIQISKPPDKSELPLELFVGERERRNQEGLCHDIALRPMRGQRRVAIIDDADVLSEEAANALLKTLEEPPPGSVLILIGTSPERQLPTIRSRCQIIRLRPPETGDAALLIARELGVTDTQLAARLARQSAGSIELAGLLLNHELGSFREFLLPALARLPAGSVALATRIVAFVEEAGKEAIERRVRLRLVIELAVEFYRDMTRRLSGTQPPADEENDPLIAQATASALAEAAHWNDEQAAECVDRCMQALSHVDRNANLATLTECWIDDLARLAAGEVPVRLTA